MTIACFIVDDQPLNIRILESYINKTPFFKLSGSVSSCEAYFNSNIGSDILLVNMDLIEAENLSHFDDKKQLLIFMQRDGWRQSETVALNAKFKNAGFLRLPVTYPLFVQEIERLIK